MVAIALAIILTCSPAGGEVRQHCDGNLVARGIGRPRPGLSVPQARLMAERAAQVVAARNLAAKTGHGWLTGPRGGENIHVDAHISAHQYGPTRFGPDGSAVASVRAAGFRTAWGSCLSARLRSALEAMKKR